MRLQKIQAKRRRREWTAFSERVVAPLTYEEITFFQEAARFEGEAWDRFIVRFAEIFGDDADAWISWWSRIDIDQISPEEAPEPPEEPEGLWDRVRSIESDEHETRCAAAYAVGLLSYARNIRKINRRR